MRDELGRYRLIRLLGRGGMGEVHLAHDTKMGGRQVAVKLLSASTLEDPELQRRFRRECEFAAQIQHPNVLPVYDYSVGDKPYIVMPYVDGKDLATFVREHPHGIAPELAVHVVGQVASALDAAHRKDLRHRDVKPSNVMVQELATDSFHAWLFDWGIAQRIEAPALTKHNQVVGTPYYLAPERLAGGSDHRADIYALAVLLYECLCGRRPFTGEDAAVLLAHMNTPPPALPPRIGAGLRAVVAKGLAKRPEDRYQTAGALAEAARAALRVETEERIRNSVEVESRPPGDTTQIPVPAAAPQPTLRQPHRAEPRPPKPHGPSRLPETAAGAAIGAIIAVALILMDVMPVDRAPLLIPLLVAAGALIAFGLRGPSAPPAPPGPGDQTRDPGGFPPPRA
ncbi:serine/threonine-protein kinase [Actinokineospora sp. G85]|uniref:serine/threonine-protein kinase n=1 Tax=Actinokineospora sp. G85 TaxID=3406626 RepID=UPI003C734799